MLCCSIGVSLICANKEIYYYDYYYRWRKNTNEPQISSSGFIKCLNSGLGRLTICETAVSSSFALSVV